MRIVVHDMVGHAFPVQLSRELARRGHHVLHLHFPQFKAPKGHLVKLPADAATFEIDGVETPEPFLKYNLIRRRFQEIAYGRLAAKRILAFSPDVVLSSGTPLDALQEIERELHKNNVKFVFWVQDLYSSAIGAVLKQKKLPFTGLIAAWYRRMEAGLLRRSDAIVVITQDFIDILRAWNVPTARVTVIQNWAPLDDVTPCDSDNPWSRSHNIAGRFCFLYSGTLGLKHNPEFLLGLAESMLAFPETVIVIISEGLGADWLREQLASRPLPNVILLPYQPWNQFAEVLSSGHVLLTLLGEEAGQFAVPSKVLTSMCAGRALLLSVPLQNLAARIVLESHSGLAADPADRQAFIDGAHKLKDDPELRRTCGINARQYAEQYFDIGKIAQRFEEIFENIAPSHPAGHKK